MNLDFLAGIGDAIDAFFENPLVQLGLQAIGVYIVIVWLASAYWAFRDMQGRTANPVVPYLAAALVVAFTPVFFIFGVLVYRIIRPQDQLGEAYERSLAEEALIAEIDQIEHCATCSRKVHEGWIICPTCRTRLKRVCPQCAKLVGLEWSLCAWCGRDFERREVPAAAPAAAGSLSARPVRDRAPASATVTALGAAPAQAQVTAPAPAPGVEPPAGAVATPLVHTTRTSRSASGTPAPGSTARG
ncbi:MAG TPA: zinc ribbon domain-containing protein [Patescibacteria group bacterium]|nr:zinc ribbon domain-containing protein [Patescibacteria group bacterium]